jgi:hypothetical protein
MQTEFECHTIEQDGEVVFSVFDSAIRARLFGLDRVKSGLATDYYVKEIQV